MLAQTNPSLTAQEKAALKELLSTLRRQAAAGHADAQGSLGAAYYLGVGVPQDYKEAAYWFRKAAEQGDTGAQFGIGDLYFRGLGVPQSYSRAYFWLDLAAAGPSPKPLFGLDLSAGTAEERDEAASHLTRSELLQVQKQAEKWFESHKAPSPTQ
jgi:TPR repeat protein